MRRVKEFFPSSVLYHGAEVIDSDSCVGHWVRISKVVMSSYEFQFSKFEEKEYQEKMVFQQPDGQTPSTSSPFLGLVSGVEKITTGGR